MQVQLQFNVKATDTGVSDQRDVQVAITNADTPYSFDEQLIGTAAEAITFGAVATPGYVYIKNKDVTNYIDLSQDNATSVFVQRLMPGEFVVLKPTAATIYAKAHTASCKIDKFITSAAVA
jgi:hypothetical protein